MPPDMRLFARPAGSPAIRPWARFAAGLGPLAHTADGSAPWLQTGHITASGQPVWLLHAPGPTATAMIQTRLPVAELRRRAEADPSAA